VKLATQTYKKVVKLSHTADGSSKFVIQCILITGI